MFLAGFPQQVSSGEESHSESSHYSRTNGDDRIGITVSPFQELIPAAILIFIYIGPAAGLMIATAGGCRWAGFGLMGCWLILIFSLLFMHWDIWKQ